MFLDILRIFLGLYGNLYSIFIPVIKIVSFVFLVFNTF